MMHCSPVLVVLQTWLVSGYKNAHQRCHMTNVTCEEIQKFASEIGRSSSSEASI